MRSIEQAFDSGTGSRGVRLTRRGRVVIVFATLALLVLVRPTASPISRIDGG